MTVIYPESPEPGEQRIKVTLTEFLLARIAEDEAAARDAHVDGAAWWVDGPAEHSGRWWVYATGEKFAAREVAEHIARHDPARVLAECEAKRWIVELHRADKGYAHRSGWTDWCVTCGDDDLDGWPCPTLRALALPYADHPDYREEWAL